MTERVGPDGFEPPRCGDPDCKPCYCYGKVNVADDFPRDASDYPEELAEYLSEDAEAKLWPR